MEYLRSEGRLLTIEGVTAASNMAGGTPVALITASSLICTLGRTVTGFATTALLGYHFLGILDTDVSAGDSPITVWTEGVFKLVASSACESGDIAPGWPVFADSGMVITASSGQTADVPIGTLVNRPAEATGSAVLHVKINPGAYRWATWIGVEYGATNLSATMTVPMAWPIRKGHA